MGGFDALVGISATQRDQFVKQGMTRPDLDPEWAALSPLILRVGATILRPHIECHLGKALLGRAAASALGRRTSPTSCATANSAMRPPALLLCLALSSPASSWEPLPPRPRLVAMTLTPRR